MENWSPISSFSLMKIGFELNLRHDRCQFHTHYVLKVHLVRVQIPNEFYCSEDAHLGQELGTK